jgi:plastocyanin
MHRFFATGSVRWFCADLIVSAPVACGRLPITGEFVASSMLVICCTMLTSTALAQAAAPLVSQPSEQAVPDAVTKEPDQNVGTVSGTITFEGDVPEFHIADATGRKRALLEVDRKQRMRYVVVYLEPFIAEGDEHQDEPAKKDAPGDPDQKAKEDAPRVPSQPAKLDGPLEPDHRARSRSAAESQGKRHEIDQRDHRFDPHLIAVREGVAVHFSNSDAGNHNIRSATLIRKNEFNVVVGPEEGYVHRFMADPKVRPVLLTCDVHPWMRAWIYVFDHARFDVTDDRGKYTISAVPPGRYRLWARQPDAGLYTQREVRVTAGSDSRMNLTFRARDVK